MHHHHLGSFDAHEPVDGSQYDSSSAASAGQPHADPPHLAADSPHPGAGAVHDPPPFGGFPRHDALTGPPPPLEMQVHVDHVTVVSAHDIQVSDHQAAPPAHEESHHDLLSLAKDTGWLNPTSPPMLLAGTALATVVGHRYKRFAARRAQELGERLANGERVVVTVDADAIDRASGRGDRLSHFTHIPGQGVERPIELVGIDAATAQVDDGGPGGPRSVTLAAFESAWERLGCVAFSGPRDTGETA